MAGCTASVLPPAADTLHGASTPGYAINRIYGSKESVRERKCVRVSVRGRIAEAQIKKARDSLPLDTLVRSRAHTHPRWHECVCTYVIYLNNYTKCAVSACSFNRLCKYIYRYYCVLAIVPGFLSVVNFSSCDYIINVRSMVLFVPTLNHVRF